MLQRPNLEPSPHVHAPFPCIVVRLLLIRLHPVLRFTADTPVPGWVNIVCGVTLFLYQTLDAIDGKQARRTKSSSALGQLFDHGCDAMSTFIGALSLCVCLQTGPQQGLTFVTIACMAFFIAQWNEYYTHVLSTNVAGVFGVTEAQVSCINVCNWRVHCVDLARKRSFIQNCSLSVSNGGRS